MKKRMKQKNPIRNEIVYLWNKEKLPIRGTLKSPMVKATWWKNLNLNLKPARGTNSEEE